MSYLKLNNNQTSIVIVIVVQMLLGIVALCFLLVVFICNLVFFNIKYHWHIQLTLCFLIGGNMWTLYICLTRYDWKRIDFNLVSLAIFVVANIEFILLFILWISSKLQRTKTVYNTPKKNMTEKKTIDNESDNNESDNESDNEKYNDIKITIDNDSHAFLICSHNSSGNIRETIVTMKKFSLEKDIFVVDNGSSSQEKLFTKNICDKENVNYICLDRGNKTIAQLVGCFKLSLKRYKYVTICDDDLILQDWNKSKIIEYFSDPLVKCVSYIVVPLHEHKILNKFQRIEYSISSYMKYLQGQMSTCFFSSGAISTWELDIIIEVLLRHNGEFKGDDMRCGMILHSLSGKKYLTNVGIHENTYKIKVSNNIIYTKVPSCAIHTYDCITRNLKCECGEPSLYHQRVKSWELSRYCFLFEYIKGIFCAKRWMTKLTYIMCIFSIFVDIFTLVALGFTIAYAINNPLMSIVLIWQVIALNIIFMIICWGCIVKNVDNIISVKWAIIMPIMYYLPSIIYIKLPSILYSMSYPFRWKLHQPLYKRQSEWYHYINKNTI